MKTKTFTRIVAGTLFLAIFLTCSVQLFSQQMVTFTNGAVMKVNIVYQTKDTIRYFKDGNPDIIFTETMDRVVKIIPAESIRDYKPGPKSVQLTGDKEYWKYKRGVTTGGALLGTGAVLTIAGVIGWSSTEKPPDNANQVLGAVFSVLGMTIGSGLFITGGIITIVNASNLSAYKREHPGISLGIKADQKMTGVSLVYRF